MMYLDRFLSHVSCIQIAMDIKFNSFNTLGLRQNARHFPDDTFKRIFLNENVRISIKIWLKFVPEAIIWTSDG